MGEGITELKCRVIASRDDGLIKPGYTGLMGFVDGEIVLLGGWDGQPGKQFDYNRCGICIAIQVRRTDFSVVVVPDDSAILEHDISAVAEFLCGIPGNPHSKEEIAHMLEYEMARRSGEERGGKLDLDLPPDVDVRDLKFHEEIGAMFGNLKAIKKLTLDPAGPGTGKVINVNTESGVPEINLPIISTPIKTTKMKLIPMTPTTEQLDQWEKRCKETGDPIPAEEVLTLISAVRGLQKEVVALHNITKARVVDIPDNAELVAVVVPGASPEGLADMRDTLRELDPDRKFLLTDKDIGFRDLSSWLADGMGIEVDRVVVSGNRVEAAGTFDMSKVRCSGNTITNDKVSVPVKVLSTEGTDNYPNPGEQMRLSRSIEQSVWNIYHSNFFMQITDEELRRGDCSLKRIDDITLEVTTPKMKLVLEKGSGISTQQRFIFGSIPRKKPLQDLDIQPINVPLIIKESKNMGGQAPTGSEATLSRTSDGDSWVIAGELFEIVITEEELSWIHSGVRTATQATGDGGVVVQAQTRSSLLLMKWVDRGDPESNQQRQMLEEFSKQRPQYE